MTNKQKERKRLDSLIEKIRVGLENRDSESLLLELNEILELECLKPLYPNLVLKSIIRVKWDFRTRLGYKGFKHSIYSSNENRAKK